MPSDVTLVALENVAANIPNAIAAGPFGSNLVSRDYVETGIPVIRGQNLSGRWVGGEFVYVSEVKARRLRTNTARPGDIVFTQRGTLGQVAIVPKDPHQLYVISQSQMKLTVDPDKADPRFVYYACAAPGFVSQIHNNAVAAGVPHINLGILRSLRIPMPNREAQVRAGDVLSSLDDRIDLLRQTNATLESIAQTLFKSWFIDFDPVRAKSEGREPEGMDAATAALFPARFEESELGSIPAGWRAGALANLSDLNARTWSARRHPDRIEYIDLGNVKSNVLGETVQYEFNEAPSRARRELRDGDTIVGTVRPGNCSFAFISRARPGLTASTGFAVLSPRLPELAEFIYLAATWRGNIERLASLADGGAYPAVRPELVAATPCVVAPGAILSAFSRIAAPRIRGTCSGGRSGYNSHCTARHAAPPAYLRQPLPAGSPRPIRRSPQMRPLRGASYAGEHGPFAKLCQREYPPLMSTMNISLPEAMKEFIDAQVATRGYGTSSEYVRDLIRREQDREKLRGLLLQGLESGPGRVADAAYFNELRESVRRRAAGPGRTGAAGSRRQAKAGKR